MANGSPTTLYGRITLRATVEVLTGLHVGASSVAGSMTGLDFPVVRDAMTGQPYLPGSSLRGKLRAELERLYGLATNATVRGGVQFYVPQSREDYDATPIGRIFGLPGSRSFGVEAASRLIVRDTFLTTTSAEALKRARTDLPYTEVKSEAAVDRVTAEAVPRQIERLPAGSTLGPLELVYSVYESRDLGDFEAVVRGLRLVEDDFVGGHGSRGSGKVRISGISVDVRSRASYRGEGGAFETKTYDDLNSLDSGLSELVVSLRSALALPA